MIGEKLVSIMLDASKNAVPMSEKTDLLYGKVVSVNPLRIQVANEPRLQLSETFLILSQLCKEMKVTLPETMQELVLWTGLQVGDTVIMLRVLQGSKFLVLQKED